MTLIGTITIPGHTASANAIDAMHLRARMAYKKAWRRDAGLSAALQVPIDLRQTKDKRRVVITGFRKRICDKINFARGCKPVLDGLVDSGVLVDDSVKWLDDEYFQIPSSDERIVIEVYEIT